MASPRTGALRCFLDEKVNLVCGVAEFRCNAACIGIRPDAAGAPLLGIDPPTALALSQLSAY
jgi:hypothetical protein